MKRCLIILVLLSACSSDVDTQNNGQTLVIEVDQGGTEDTSGDSSTTPDVGDVSVEEDLGGSTACGENLKYEGVKAILAGGKNNPTGRGEQGAIFDPCNQRVILFGGNDQQPEQCASFGAKNYLGDTWGYSLEFKNWYRIETQTAPSARGRFVYAFDTKRKNMVIFGGRFRAGGSGNYTMYNETWSFNVVSDEWEEIKVTGDKPIARINSAMVYDEKNDRFIMFGGNSSASGLSFSPLNDTWIFTPSDNKWEKIQTANSPSRRLYHSMAIDTASNKAIVYSGGDENAFVGPFTDDLHALDLDTLSWEKLYTGNGTSANPKARINSQLIEDKEQGRLLLFGGHDDGFLGNDNDLWSFDVASKSFTLIERGDVYSGEGCSSFCTCPSTFVNYNLEVPERRSYPTFVTDLVNNQIIMFGGTGDCGYMDDTWFLHLDTNKWEEVHEAEQGISCERTDRAECTELCF